MREKTADDCLLKELREFLNDPYFELSKCRVVKSTSGGPLRERDVDMVYYVNRYFGDHGDVLIFYRTSSQRVVMMAQANSYEWIRFE